MILSCCHKGTDALYALYTGNTELMVEFINGGPSLYFDETALFQAACDFRHLIIFQKHLDCDRVRKIRHIKHQDRLFIADLSGFHGQHLTADGHLTHLTGDGLNIDRSLFRIASVDHIGIV